jgi:exodeoxyribonuclease-5
VQPRQIDFTPDQQGALDAILAWYRYDNGQPLTLGGYAGTGKTTLVGQLERFLPRKRIIYCSFTGKAVSVLASKLPPGATVSTLHRLLYHPQPSTVCKVSGERTPEGGYCSVHLPGPMDSKTSPPKPCSTVQRLDWSSKVDPLRDFDLVVADEASMIGDKLWADLIGWGTPVLAVGDHGQLPPVKSQYNLMENPMIRLERIHRQAIGSPIIQLSMIAREAGMIDVGEYGPGVRKVRPGQIGEVEIDSDAGDLVIVGYNRTRNMLNDQMRARYGRSGLVTAGDHVICLRNNYEAGVFNGMRGRVLNVGDAYANGDSVFINVKLDDGEYAGEAFLPQFGAPKTRNEAGRWYGLWDFGYALTCHKAQGSQARRVVVIEEDVPGSEYRRWLYTAVTRAEEELVLVGN